MQLLGINTIYDLSLGSFASSGNNMQLFEYTIPGSAFTGVSEIVFTLHSDDVYGNTMIQLVQVGDINLCDRPDSDMYYQFLQTYEAIYSGIVSTAALAAHSSSINILRIHRATWMKIGRNDYCRSFQFSSMLLYECVFIISTLHLRLSIVICMRCWS